MTILLADDHPLIVSALQQGLTSLFPDFTILTAYQLSELKEQFQNTQIDLLLQDIKFGVDDARTFLPELIHAFPNTKIIVLTSLADAITIQQLIKLGVKGYILKSDEIQLIEKGITEVLAGKSFISPTVQANLAASDLVVDENPAEIHLSSREKEVLREILKEKSIKEIAETLFINDKTVEHHRANLFVKLQVKNVSGLVKKAIILGLID